MDRQSSSSSWVCNFPSSSSISLSSSSSSSGNLLTSFLKHSIELQRRSTTDWRLGGGGRGRRRMCARSRQQHGAVVVVSGRKRMPSCSLLSAAAVVVVGLVLINLGLASCLASLPKSDHAHYSGRVARMGCSPSY